MNIDLTYAKTDGPFLVYFELDYDMSQEGVVAVALSQYEQESTSFKEVGLYTYSEQQSLVLQVVEKARYVLSIQPIASSKTKFSTIGNQKVHMNV